MKKTVSALAAVGLAALLATPAAASAGTHVKITSWKVMTSDGMVHKVSPGATFKACASRPADNLVAKGKVQAAKKGNAYDAVWSDNGKRFAKFSETWKRSGSFRTTFGLGAEGFQPGAYKLKLVENSKAIGKSAITLKTKKGC